jgi:hypothetical protein
MILRTKENPKPSNKEESKPTNKKTNTSATKIRTTSKVFIIVKYYLEDKVIKILHYFTLDKFLFSPI